jgi:uncharacterized protein YndB with AHSA1/START domain
MGERYEFTDVWTIPTAIDLAWRMVDDVAGWPKWWPDYRSTEVVADIKHGPGTRWHVKVKSDLPYTLDFNFTVLAHEPPRYVRTRVEGFFDGEIDWRLEALSPDMTRMTLHEQTETKWALINLTARLGGRRLLISNHKSAMRRGEAGMKAALARGYSPPDLDSTSLDTNASNPGVR